MLALYGANFSPLAPLVVKRPPAFLPAPIKQPPGGIVLPTSTPPPAPQVPPVSITTAPPPDVMTTAPTQVPGAGPTATMTPAPTPSSNWYDLFDPNAFAWWKPVLLAVGLAAFGGAIIAGVRAATKRR